jgi:hypothetical protein
LANSTDIRTWRSLACGGTCGLLWHPGGGTAGAGGVGTKSVLPVRGVRAGLRHTVHGLKHE